MDSLDFDILTVAAMVKNMIISNPLYERHGVNALYFNDFMKSHTRKEVIYWTLLRSIAEAKKCNIDTLESDFFDSARKEIIKENPYYALEVLVRQVIKIFVKLGYDLEDITVADVLDYINQELKVEFDEELNKIVDTHSIPQEESFANTTIVEKAFTRVRNSMLAAVSKYSEEKMVQRISKRYELSGNIIRLSYCKTLEPPTTTFDPCSNMALAIKVGYFVWRDPDGSVRILMECLMHATREELLDVMAKLGYKQLHDTIDVYYNLLWFLVYGKFNRKKLSPTMQEREYISGLSSQQILDILGPSYVGPHDRASLIITAISGKVTALPEIADIPRYSMIASASPAQVWGLAHKLYRIINRAGATVSDYPPYKYVALQLPHPIEHIVLSVNDNNVDTMLKDFSLIGDYENIDTMLQEFGMNLSEEGGNKVNYFINQIVNPGRIFPASWYGSPLPELTGLTEQEIKDALKTYSLRELLNVYKVPYEGETHMQYIAKIAKISATED